MTFRLFIYYSALAGALSALLAWAVGLAALGVSDSVTAAGVKGMILALILALALSLIDGLWNVGLGRPLGLLARIFCAVFVGAMAGLLGGLLSQALVLATGLKLVFILVGYLLEGTLIGASLGLFDLVAALATNKPTRAAVRKVRNGFIGGLLGGAVGGGLSVFLHSSWGRLFEDRTEAVWSPSAAAFAALGLCLGLLIGLTQVFLKEAWLRVEKGFRSGRELILSRDEITIGRAESCDVGLFGDPSVEKLHARIVRQDGEYQIADAGTPAGTYVNEMRIGGPRRLSAGDEIRIGRCVLRFGERAKR